MNVKHKCSPFTGCSQSNMFVALRGDFPHLHHLRAPLSLKLYTFIHNSGRLKKTKNRRHQRNDHGRSLIRNKGICLLRSMLFRNREVVDITCLDYLHPSVKHLSFVSLEQHNHLVIQKCIIIICYVISTVLFTGFEFTLGLSSNFIQPEVSALNIKACTV